jgi:hypothetical protein
MFVLNQRAESKRAQNKKVGVYADGPLRKWSADAHYAHAQSILNFQNFLNNQKGTLCLS